jgi:hypothetical protein
MTKQKSPTDVAVELLGDLQNFQRTGSKEAFREEMRREFVRRSGLPTLDQALLKEALINAAMRSFAA